MGGSTVKAVGIETALLDLVVTSGGPCGERWLEWLVQGGAPPQSGTVEVAWPAGESPA